MFHNTNYLNPFKDDLSHFNNVLNAYKNSEKLILYFHGGLSSSSYIKNDLGPMLSKTTFNPKNMSYESNEQTIIYAHPVMVQWEASIFQSDSLYSIFRTILTDHMKKTGFEEILKDLEKIWEWLKHKLRFDKALFVDQEPSEQEISARAYAYLQNLESRSEVHDLINGDYNYSVIELIHNELIESEVKDITQRLEGKINRDKQALLGISKWELAKVIYRTLDRYRQDRAHGPITTLQEEIYREPMLFDTSIEDIATNHWKMVYDHANAIWEKEISKNLLSDLNNKNIQIDLISHSAGAIIISSLIEHVATHREIYPNITFNNIIFVVPAVTTKMFENTIMKHEKSNIYRKFVTYNLSDECEIKDQVGLELIYSRSLLYFVSGIAEKIGKGDTPILGMQRYMMEDSIYQSKEFNDDYNEDYGDLCEIKKYLTQGDRLKYVPFSNTGLTCKESGSSHGGTKMPCISKELAKDIVNLISDNRISHDNVWLDCPSISTIEQEDYEDF